MIIAKTDKNKDLVLLPQLANRHGLITGATGTGKTVTLRKMIEEFSKLGIPVFVSDVKGELSGLNSHFSVQFFDLWGDIGCPIQTTISQLGDLLLARMLDLNKVQTGIITLMFKICDDNNFILKDLNCVKQTLIYLADHAYDFKREFGNITYSSVGAIQREVLSAEKQGVNQFFDANVFDIYNLFRKDDKNQGVINILRADTLIKFPKLYCVFLLWLLSETYEMLPEEGDLEKPKFVFFFDEAHLLFKDCPKILLEKIEQMVRLIRSKGVGVYFATQNPLDVPDSILGQLGNRVQHALRAFTARDRKAIKAIGETYRDNPEFKTSKVIPNLKIGEALISFLQPDGDPSMVEKSKVIMPISNLKPLSDDEVRQLAKKSDLFYEKGEKPVYRMKINESGNVGLVETLGRNVVRSLGNRIGHELIRGFFNTFLRGTRGGLGR